MTHRAAARKSPRPSAPPRERGSAFAAIVLPLLILAAIAAAVTTGTRAELLTTRTIEAEIQSRLAAEAAIATAILQLMAPAGGLPWAADGSVYKVSFAGHDVEISIQNERAKINLNQTPNPPLERLFTLSCLGKDAAARLMDRIADYIDEDGLPRRLGAELEFYADAGLAHGPANGRFQTLSELRRVPGVTPDLFARVRPFVTVHGFHDIPELRLASPKTVMSVLDIDEKAANAVRARGSNAGPGPAVGVFTLSARVVTRAKPPAATQAIVYVTGDGAAPARILDWRHDEAEEVPALPCPAGEPGKNRP